MQQQPLAKAFGHALDGLRYFFSTDRNGKIHGAAGSCVLLAGIYFELSKTEWCVLVLCIAAVISIEMINHSIEKLCDMVHADRHPVIKTIKDISAAAVLWCAMASAIIGLIIFVPKILSSL